MTEPKRVPEFGSVYPEAWYSEDYRNDVQAFYESKTETLQRRYREQPRVHYHSGLVDEVPAEGTPIDVRHKLMFESQDRLLEQMRDLWRTYQSAPGTVLDVGCGLGGGSIFWAQQFGAKVTGVTIESRHVPIVAELAATAGVGDRVEPKLADVLTMKEREEFDAAVAVESLCHISRTAFFARMSKVLKPEGHIVIADYFKGLGPTADARTSAIDAHWKTHIATIQEHLDAAHENGFRLLALRDLSRQTRKFWQCTAALWKLEADHKAFEPAERARWEASVAAHEGLYEGLREDGLEYAVLVFKLGRTF